MSTTVTANAGTGQVSKSINDGVSLPKDVVATHPLIISNRAYTTSTSFPVYSPSSGALLHYFSSASIADTTHAIEVSQTAFEKWRILPPPRKRDIFLKAASIMESRKEKLMQFCVQEAGASLAWAEFNLNLAVDILRDVSGRISSITGSIPSTSQPGTNALVFKEPYGVILSIAPWNAPFILGVRSIAYPLAAGNSVILKAPELSPLCSHAIVSCFHDAGLPEGVLNLIAHQPSDAAAITKHLIEHPSIKKVNFTGSTAVGKIIASVAGQNLKPLLLELGGKAPAIVLDDADLEHAAAACAVGAFLHSGQICMSTERVIVHELVADAFEAAFKKAVLRFAPEGQERGCLINTTAAERIKRLLADATVKGAIIVHGDPTNDVEPKMSPVIIKGVRKDMDIFYAESFGPTVCLMTVRNDEEALELANDTEYGLSASVFTTDLGRALRLARRIESGAVHINEMTVHDETSLPHGGKFFLLSPIFYSTLGDEIKAKSGYTHQLITAVGVKASGYGRFGASGLDEWVRTKTTTYRD